MINTTDSQTSNNTRVPLILFSGGLDSTYLVSEALKTSDVHVMYVVGPQDPIKVTKELEARENIKRYLVDNREFKILHDYTYVDNTNTTIQDSKYVQVLSWINAAMRICDAGIHSSVQIGYVDGGGIQYYIPELVQCWDCLSKVVKRSPVELLFPLATTPKNFILKKMEKELYNLTWVCEYPYPSNDVYEPCTYCDPCVTRTTELFKIENEIRTFVKKSNRHNHNLKKETP
jgi:7-cyano-7-deazaguanine synthase in queuosine biosynthesis